MLQRPDAQSFSRFLASLGVFLCLAAVVGPGLILRETDVLRMTRAELAGVTPDARDELERRQQVAIDVGRLAPFVGAALLLLGSVLIVYAAPRLREQEQAENARSSAELDRLRREIVPQNKLDRLSRVEAEAEAEAPPLRLESVDAAAETSVAHSPHVEPLHPVAKQARMDAYLEAERAVLERVRAIAPPRYEVLTEVKLESLLLDGLLVSKVDQVPDVIIEVTLVDPGRLSARTRRAIDETLGRVVRYRHRAAPSAVGWLVIVVDGPVPADSEEPVRRAALDVAQDIAVTLVSRDEINSLQIPQDRFR